MRFFFHSCSVSVSRRGFLEYPVKSPWALITNLPLVEKASERQRGESGGWGGEGGREGGEREESERGKMMRERGGGKRGEREGRRVREREEGEREGRGDGGGGGGGLSCRERKRERWEKSGEEGERGLGKRREREALLFFSSRPINSYFAGLRHEAITLNIYPSKQREEHIRNRTLL